MQEIWKPIKNYERYYISNLGRVKSLRKEDKCPNGGKFIRAEIIMKLSDSNGYKRVSLLKDKNYKFYFVHRLVAEAFIKNSEDKPFVNHINGKRDDNSVKNLEWCTQKENVIHSFKMGRKIAVGEDRTNSTLTKKEAIMVKELIGKGLMPTPISQLTGINVGIIYNIKAGKSWKHV